MEVEHKIYGTGKVIEIVENRIAIEFKNGIKKFPFPQAFDTFLKTENRDLLNKVHEEKNKVVMADKNQSFASGSSIPKGKIDKKQTFHSGVNYTKSNSLVGERAQSIGFNSKAELFEVIGYMSRPGRVSSIEAEIPKDGRDEIFETMFPGQKYRPIEMGYTPSGMPNKLSPQFRINFANLRNCPNILKANMGKGNGSCVGRINKSKFVIDIVHNYGFRFGEYQDVNAIRDIAINAGYEEEFIKGYNR